MADLENNDKILKLLENITNETNKILLALYIRGQGNTIKFVSPKYHSVKEIKIDLFIATVTTLMTGLLTASEDLDLGRPEYFFAEFKKSRMIAKTYDNKGVLLILARRDLEIGYLRFIIRKYSEAFLDL